MDDVPDGGHVLHPLRRAGRHRREAARVGGEERGAALRAAAAVGRRGRGGRRRRHLGHVLGQRVQQVGRENGRQVGRVHLVARVGGAWTNRAA